MHDFSFESDCTVFDLQTAQVSKTELYKYDCKVSEFILVFIAL